MKVIIPDLDFYVETCNFSTLKSRGVFGSIIRAGQRYWKDSKAPDFMIGARDNNLPIGSYWYFDSRESPKKQAEYWSEVLEGFDTPLRCWADFEDSYNGSYSGWRNWYDFLEYSKQAMPGRKFGIYTGYYYWLEHCPNPTYFSKELAYFAQYPLWLSWYTTNKADIKIPTPWSKETLWQYTENGEGRYYGTGSLGIDLNEFNGTWEECEQFFDYKTQGGAPMPEAPRFEGTITWSEGSNVRKEPFVNNMTNPTIRVLPKNTTFKAIQIRPITPGVEEWMQLDDGNWFALIFAGKPRASYRLITNPPPVSCPDIQSMEITLTDGTKYRATGFEKI